MGAREGEKGGREGRVEELVQMQERKSRVYKCMIEGWEYASHWFGCTYIHFSVG